MIPMLDGNTRGKTTVGAAVGFVKLGSAIVKTAALLQCTTAGCSDRQGSDGGHQDPD